MFIELVQRALALPTALKPSIRKQICHFHLFYCYVNTFYQTKKYNLIHMICWLICPYMLAGL